MKNQSMPLVSIVTPCYNGALFLNNYFESILKQDYPNLEVVIVNDGSKDDSMEIIQSYADVLKRNNIELIAINKDNEGQMKAVQDGVLSTHGEYLTWPDVDDIMEPTYISDKVSNMKNNPNVDILINPVEVYKFGDEDNPIGKVWSKPYKSKEELIYRFIEDKDSGYMPGAYMLKMDSLMKIYPDKRFYCGLKAGVAIPLVFPFIYSFNSIYMDKPLYKYFVHENNQHSKNELRDIKNLEILYNETFEYMKLSDEEKESLRRRIDNRCLQLQLGYAYRTMDKKSFYEVKRKLRENHAFRFKDLVKEIALKFGIKKGAS